MEKIMNEVGKSTREEMLDLMLELNECTNGVGDKKAKKNALGLVRNAAEKAGKLFVEISIDDLKVDMRYQRKIEAKHVDDISKNWNFIKYDPLKVNYRGDGYFYVVDGQHRLEAAKRKNIDYLLCEVIVGLTVETEAALFGSQGSGVKKPNQYDIFKANILAGEKTDTIIKNICDEYHLIVRPTHRPNSLTCLTLARNMIKRGHKEDFKWVLKVLDKAKYNTYKDGHSYAIVFAAWDIKKCYEKDIKCLEKDLIKILKSFIPEELFVAGRALHPECSHPSNTIECILLDMLNEIRDINIVKKEVTKIQEKAKQKKVG